MQQLSGADSGFLQFERGNNHMHIGALAIYDPSTHPDGSVRFKDVLRYFAARAAQFPQFRRRLVTLPMISQSLGAAWLLTFSLSLDDVVTSAFLSGPGATTLPLVIFSRARLGLNPSVNAVASVTIVVVAICVAVASVLVARSERRRTQEISSASRGE